MELTHDETISKSQNGKVGSTINLRDHIKKIEAELNKGYPVEAILQFIGLSLEEYNNWLETGKFK